ncbi:MAG: TlpA disulfide reductase family protein [Actinomycetota bacterium]
MAIAIIVAIVIAVAAIIAIAVTSGGDSDTEGLSQTQDVEISGSALPPLTDGGDDPAIGLPAPSISGQSFDGTPVRVELGQPTMLVFLAHWCPVCQREVPELVAWEAAGGVPDGVQVIGVATATDQGAPNHPPSSWLEGEDFPFPVIADDDAGSLATALGLPAYPYYVLLDENGRVVARGTGETPPDQLTALAEQALTA